MAITDAEGLHGVGTELVTNGTFDSATTGWTLANNATLSVASDGQVGNCLQITCDGSNNPGATSTVFTLSAGKTYQFSFWVKAGTEATFQAYVNDSVSTWGVTSNTEAQSTWRKYSYTFEATADSAAAVVYLSQIATAGAATYLYFDSVSVIEVAQWLEKPTVIFTAGTLSTIENCISEVESKLKRGTLSASTTPSTTDVTRWLVRAKEELAEIKNFTWTRRYAYLTTTAGVWRYGLPSDYHGGDVFLRDITNDKIIYIWPEIGFNSEYPDPAGNSSDEPDVGCIRGMELWLNCPAKSTYTYELEYNRSGDDNIPTDFSWLPEIDRFRCCDFAIYQSWMSVHEWQVAQMYKAEWMYDLDKARKADGKKRWKGMDYHCPLWFK